MFDWWSFHMYATFCSKVMRVKIILSETQRLSYWCSTCSFSQDNIIIKGITLSPSVAAWLSHGWLA